MTTIKASEIGSYLEQTPERYSAVLQAAAKWCVHEAVRHNTDLEPPATYCKKVLRAWFPVLPSDDPEGDFDAILDFIVNGLESDYIAKTLPLPIAVWYAEQKNKPQC